MDKAYEAMRRAPLLGLDNRPLLINGDEVLAGHALVARNWVKIKRQLRAEAYAAAVAATKLNAKRNKSVFQGVGLAPSSGELEEGRRVTMVASEATALAATKRRRARGSVWGGANLRTASSDVAASPEDTITDEEFQQIYELNSKLRMGSVAPRVLEPLISLTLSDDPGEVRFFHQGFFASFCDCGSAK